MEQERKRRTQAEVRETLLRGLREFTTWNGDRRDGHWVPESVRINVKRTYRHFAKSKTEFDDRGRPKVVEIDAEEVVYNHSGYRPKFAGEAKTRKAFFHRGARVWRP